MVEKISLKDQLFNIETVTRLGRHFADAGVFKVAPFVADVMARMPDHELMARVHMIAAVLERYLPDDFPTAAQAIHRALPPPLDPRLTDNDFGHFIYAPLGVYVENRGLTDHLDDSLTLLAALTQRFSMEFSIRTFLNHHQGATLERLHDWVTHDSYHVRRLVSEGTRPKMPWGKAIGLTIDDTLPLLDRLQGDNTRFVTRSVANHLNDITKKDPDVVIARLADWQGIATQTEKELEWMRRHALRSLVKGGHAGAMMHLGYRPDVAIDLTDLHITPTDFRRGDQAQIGFTVICATDAPLIIDYVIDFIKANGKTAPKVFKLKNLNAQAGQTIRLQKTHHFKNNATTFTLHSGAHRVHIQINGRIVGTVPFILR